MGEAPGHVCAAATDQLFHLELSGSVPSDPCEGHWDCSSAAKPCAFWNKESPQHLQLGMAPAVLLLPKTVTDGVCVPVG